MFTVHPFNEYGKSVLDSIRLKNRITWGEKHRKLVEHLLVVRAAIVSRSIIYYIGKNLFSFREEGVIYSSYCSHSKTKKKERKKKIKERKVTCRGSTVSKINKYMVAKTLIS